MIPALGSKLTNRMMKHKKETGHTKFTILSRDKKRKKHQLNWQIIKCKQYGSSIS